MTRTILIIVAAVLQMACASQKPYDEGCVAYTVGQFDQARCSEWVFGPTKSQRAEFAKNQRGLLQ